MKLNSKGSLFYPQSASLLLPNPELNPDLVNYISFKILNRYPILIGELTSLITLDLSWISGRILGYNLISEEVYAAVAIMVGSIIARDLYGWLINMSINLSAW